MNILKILTEKRRVGNFGERAAGKFLKRKGYKILEKNFVALESEIDVIARKDELTVFCEVKTRNRESSSLKEPRPASSVTPEKQRKIIKAASYYKSVTKDIGRMRFDVIEVYIDKTPKGERVSEIKQLEGAFDKSSAYIGQYKR